MDEVKLFPIWIFDLLLSHVLPDAVEHLAGIRRSQKFKYRRNTAVDIPSSMALGLSRYFVLRGRSTVCFRLLQRDAHLHGTGNSYHGFI